MTDTKPTNDTPAQPEGETELETVVDVAIQNAAGHIISGLEEQVADLQAELATANKARAEAEADATAMREALAELNFYAGEPGRKQATIDLTNKVMLATTAGRDFLDRLERAERERDALRDDINRLVKGLREVYLHDLDRILGQFENYPLMHGWAQMEKDVPTIKTFIRTAKSKVDAALGTYGVYDDDQQAKDAARAAQEATDDGK